NSGGSSLMLSSNGGFSFATAQLDGANNDMVGLAKPVGQVCHVRDNHGTIAGISMNNLAMQCSSDTM
ncbi:MAG: hypothetical protein NZL89_03595, partial [Leptospiraceae bacterium]|nr:hypothetical protein [Leptospiraceae bacterium]